MSVRPFLDRLYRGSLWLAALCLAAIAVMVGLQLLGRIADRLLKLVGLSPYGFVILSLAEMAGYLLAAASFLALAGTLKSGTHIRVTMLLGAFGERARRVLELLAFGAATVFALYVSWQLARFAYDSWRFNEVSPGLIPVPLALPQAAMALGMLVLAVALADEFAIILRRGRPSFRAVEDAVTLGKEG